MTRLPLLGLLLAAAPAMSGAPKHAFGTPRGTDVSALDPDNANAALYLHPPAAKPAAPVEFPELKRRADGYWDVTFGHLASFPFALPEEGAAGVPPPENPIPAAVRALDGQRVRLGGYMLPVRMEQGRVQEFLLIRSPMVCCFGSTPAPNEWVVVKMAGPGVAQQMDLPLHFYGTLHVGEIRESGVFEGLYRLDCEKVSAE